MTLQPLFFFPDGQLRQRVLALASRLTNDERHFRSLASLAPRPWHQAFIAERSALFQSSYALTGVSRDLFTEAYDNYSAWGAQRTVQQLQEAGERGLLPSSAFRFFERTREMLLVDDATCDERFFRDPYISELQHGSLMLMPLFSNGTVRAVLMLENRLSSCAFAADRLEAVTLLAGQLTVSLDNAVLYTSLERKVAERTEVLAEANERLESLQCDR